MSTKTTVQLLGITGTILLVLMFPGSTTRHTILYVLVAIAAFLGLGLLGYAWVREKSQGHKSMNVSPRFTASVFCVLGLWMSLVIIRALTR